MCCPICYENIDGEKNRVITECGHCFHTSCLMTHAAVNGFGCPYCRERMTLSGIESSDNVEEQQIPDVVGDENYGLVEEGHEDLPDARFMPTPVYMAHKVQEVGITMEDVIQLMMNEMMELRDERVDGPLERKLYDRMRDIIAEYRSM